MSRFPVHDAVVAWAKGEQAKGIHEVPLGSNTGARVRFYQNADWLPGTGYPWCASFVDAAWEYGAGQPLPWPTAGAWDMGNRAGRSGWRVNSYKRLVPGDIVTFNTGAGHVALFLRYDAKKNMVYTIDGNVSDRVDYRVRPAGQVRDLIRVPEATIAVVPLARPALFEVVTSDDGERVIYVSGARAIGKHLGRFLANNPAGLVIRRKKAKR